MSSLIPHTDGMSDLKRSTQVLRGENWFEVTTWLGAFGAGSPKPVTLLLVALASESNRARGVVRSAALDSLATRNTNRWRGEHFR
eukprot:9487303-Alexandrium_andersonii.AAC.1